MLPSPTSPADDEANVEQGVFSFGVDTGLLFQLGEQLVARRSVALAELIKNAYDADASRVDVLFEDVTEFGGTIIVQDDGLGMTFERVRDAWMQVATPSKVREPMSPGGRARTGAKGVGRFAARRLGDELTVVTVAARDDGTKEEVTVRFDWKGQFKPGQPLTEVPVRYTRRPVSQAERTGTVISIEAVRDEWEEDDLAALRRDLITLANPFQSEAFDDLRPVDSSPATDEGRTEQRKAREAFEVVIQSPEFPEQEGALSDLFLGARWASLAGVVRGDGRAEYRLRIRPTDEDLTYEAAETAFGLIPGAKFLIFGFVYKGDLFGEFDFGVNEARKLGRDIGGVRIYLDDFRVFPYGDQKDDWLRLNEMRASRTPQLMRRGEGMKEAAGLPPTERPELLMFGTNQLFGAVEISRFGQKAVEVNVSRERLVENDAFEQLRGFVQAGIYWMTVQYARVTQPEREARRREREVGAVARAEDVQALLERVQELIQAKPDVVAAQLPQIRGVMADLSSSVGELRFAQEVEERDRLHERSMLRILASTGTSLSIMTHQLEGLSEGAAGIATDLSELVEDQDCVPVEELAELRVDAADWSGFVEQQVALLSLLLGRKSRKRRRQIPVRPLVERVVDSFRYHCKDQGVRVMNGVPDGFKTPAMYEAEVGAVLMNAVTNALKALRRVDRSERWLGFDVEESDGALILRVLDSGPGVPEADRERVFEPYVSTSEPDPILGAGTGLGLMVVRDLLSGYGATAAFVDPPFAQPPADGVSWSTAFEITLPR